MTSIIYKERKFIVFVFKLFSCFNVERYAAENNHIYYKPVPTGQLDVPEGKCLTIPIAWTPPKPAYDSLY